MTTISLNELKSKIRASYKRKLKGTKGTKSTKEIALVFKQKYKGICKNCGKQGHKANLCQSKMNTSGTNANGTNEKMRLRCYKCNKYVGNIARDCPEPKGALYSEKKNKTGMYVGMCEENMEVTNATMEVTNTTETPTEELLRMCFVPTMEDEWYKDQYCTSSNGMEHWLADTGATTHITMTDEYMTNVGNVNVSVIVGDGKEVVCTKRGDILIANKTCSMLLCTVLCNSHFHKNIVSIGQFVKNGRRVRGTHEGVRVESTEGRVRQRTYLFL